MFKFERDDVVKIPFKGKIVDGRVKDCRVYYDSKEKKAYNQYSVKIRGAKHFKKIFEDDSHTLKGCEVSRICSSKTILTFPEIFDIIFSSKKERK